ncbi:MAG: dephospho-CoA kinase [Hyphomicrobiales bacterium]
MFTIGLTGSIGMGKSDTAKLFASHGWPVFDADAAVHRLYTVGGAAVAPVKLRFPDAIVNGAVDRKALAQLVLGKPDALADLEAIVHPLVRREQEAFRARAASDGCEAVVLDIPLLLEQGRESDVDVVVVVSAPADVQRERVLSRPGMTNEKFRAILAAQMPDSDKRAKADFVVDTGAGREAAATQVEQIVRTIRTQRLNAQR